MAVRAKFYVNSIKQSNMGKNAEPGYTLELLPVTSGSQENDQFYRFTPGGKLELSTVNTEAAKQFEVGKEYYLDIFAA